MRCDAMRYQVGTLADYYLDAQDELNARLRDKYRADLHGPAPGCAFTVFDSEL